MLCNYEHTFFYYFFFTLHTDQRTLEGTLLSTLLYGSECWTTYAKQIKQLNSFHLRCLRRILHIKWQDKITNVEVLRRSHMLSMHSILSERRLRCLGHVHRMGLERIPRALL